MYKKLIVANWKSNKNPDEAVAWLEELKQKIDNIQLNADNFEVVICPPFIDIPVLNDRLKVISFKFSVKLGAQDISPFDDGSYTGAVSGKQLKGFIDYCLVGHSERRKYFGETTEMVAQKIEKLSGQKIIPIICAENRENIPAGISSLAPDAAVVMFEPSTAISINGVYRAEDPNEVNKTITSWKSIIGAYQMLYGGSVNPENAKQLLDAGAEGFVIGKASLLVDSFVGILLNV